MSDPALHLNAGGSDAATAPPTVAIARPVKGVRPRKAGELHGGASPSAADVESAKESFTAVTAHELRTPVTVVSGLLDTVDGRWDLLCDADRRRLVRAARDQSRRLALHVSNALAVSQALAGDLRPDFGLVDLHELLDQVVERVGPPGPVGVVVPGHRVVTDASILGQVLERLVENARVYGAPPIELVARSDRLGGLTISCRDHGPGIDPEFAPHLFRPFSQADGGTTRTSKGLGLGLPAARALAHTLGGHLRHEAWAGPGACFRLELPPAGPLQQDDVAASSGTHHLA